MSGLGTRRKGRKTEWDISIPEELAFRIETLCADRGTGKPVYGFRSQLCTQLLEDWAAQREKDLRSDLHKNLPNGYSIPVRV